MQSCGHQLASKRTWKQGSQMILCISHAKNRTNFSDQRACLFVPSTVWEQSTETGRLSSPCKPKGLGQPTHKPVDLHMA